MKETSNTLENLPDDSIEEIMNLLNEKDNAQLTRISKEFFNFDPREVVLNLPLKKSKVPSDFVCEHLKSRKKLAINIKSVFDILSFDQSSLEMKYLKCLSGVESLRFGRYTDETKILGDPDFNLLELFPKLRHLSLKLNVNIPFDDIPNSLKSLSMYVFNSHAAKFDSIKTQLKEKITKMKHLETLALDIYDTTTKGHFPLTLMISELKHLPNFKKLTIDYEGSFAATREILAQTKDAKFTVELIR